MRNAVIISILLLVLSGCTILTSTQKAYLNSVDETIVEDWHVRVEADQTLDDVQKEVRKASYNVWKDWLDELNN
jgi:hypothetical protein